MSVADADSLLFLPRNGILTSLNPLRFSGIITPFLARSRILPNLSHCYEPRVRIWSHERICGNQLPLCCPSTSSPHYYLVHPLKRVIAQLPCIRRMSQRPQLPPISHLHAIADHRVAPEPFELPSPQPNTPEPRIGSSSSGSPNQEAYCIPISRAPIPPNQPATSCPSGRFPPQYAITPPLSGRAGANPRAPHPYHPVAGHLVFSTPSQSRSAMAHHARLPTIPGSYVAVLEKGNVGANYIWNEHYLAQLAELEPLALDKAGEKGRAFWKVWVDLHEPGLDLRDKAKKYQFITRALRAFPWYKGEETLGEAIQAMERLDGLQKALAARKYAQHVQFVLNRPTPGMTVMEFLEAEQRRRALAAAAQAQAQR